MSATLTPTTFAQEFGLLPTDTTAPVAPAVQSVKYTTQYGDRWDLIAWRIYGDISLQDFLVQVNPQIAISCVLPQGTVIYAPVLDLPQPGLTTPWAP